MSDLTETGRGEAGIRQCELSMVEQVENLGAELEFAAFGQVERLVEREIEIDLSL